MAAHSVKLKVEHPLTVGNVGVEFEVRIGGKLLGKLEVTQSTIDWTPAKARNPRKVSWQEFGDWMEAQWGRRDGSSRTAPRQGREIKKAVAAEGNSSDAVSATALEPREEDASRSRWV
jgi:hypothetical protein